MGDRKKREWLKYRNQLSIFIANKRNKSRGTALILSIPKFIMCALQIKYYPSSDKGDI